MTERHPYSFVLLRYRHDPWAGEFINVGVVIHLATPRHIDARVKTTLSRITDLFPDPNLDRRALRATLRGFESAVRSFGRLEANDLVTDLPSIAALTQRVLPDDDASFFWGPEGSGLTDDPERTLNDLYERYVAQYEVPLRRRREDEDVWRPVREKLNERQLADRLQSKVIASDLNEFEFEHAYKNGAWHCFQPLSFDLATAATIGDKADRWVGRLYDLRRSDVPFQPYLIVGGPDDAELLEAYDKAINRLAQGPCTPRVIDGREVDKIVGLIESMQKASAD